MQPDYSRPNSDDSASFCLQTDPIQSSPHSDKNKIYVSDSVEGTKEMSINYQIEEDSRSKTSSRLNIPTIKSFRPPTNSQTLIDKKNSENY